MLIPRATDVTPLETVLADLEDKASFKRIQFTVKKKLDNVEKARFAFNFRSRRIVVRESILKAIQVVSVFKSLINGAIAAKPHATIAWAGIMTILPMSICSSGNQLLLADTRGLLADVGKHLPTR